MKEIQQFIVENEGQPNEISYLNPEWEKGMRKKRYDLFLNKSGIPEFYWNIDFDDYVGDKNSIEYRKIKHYANNITDEKFNYVSLYLWGSPGCQKTSNLCNILKEAMKQGLRTKFILAGNLISNLLKLQGYSFDQDIYDYIKELKNCDVLGIDDIGDIEKSIQWNKSSLITAEWDNFFREVLSSKTKIIMTSNFSIDSIKQFFSESLFELIDRNTENIQLTSSVKQIRKLNIKDAFMDIK